MKKIITTALLVLSVCQPLFPQNRSADFVTSDISNFWRAYDKIISIKDSAGQYALLNRLFIEKGSPGLKAIMEVRRYTAKSYVDAINNYPLFWRSIRQNTLKARKFADSIALNTSKLKKLYPELIPAKIYFTIGALLTGGTTSGGKILIGSEIALSDSHTVASEFPTDLNGLTNFFKSDPIKNIVFNNVHEYVHTQQKTTVCDNLLAQSVMEGVAEFIAEKATGKRSDFHALKYGREHPDRVRQVFASQIFNPSTGFWLYSNAENEFGVRDLGYYVGYVICEEFYNKANDKKQAIKEMIQLNYNDEEALSQFVNRSGYFATSVEMLKNNYEAGRPVVIAMKPFKNGAKDVSTDRTEITIEFSKVMDTRYRNFGFGPLGETAVVKITKVIGFSEDGRSITFQIELKPDHHYQMIIGTGFRTRDGIQLKPYLVDFSTGK